MCGRYSIAAAPEALCGIFAVDDSDGDRINPEPRYNMAPMQMAPVVRHGDDGRRRMDMLRWGLVPAWAPDGSRAASMINARCESVAEKPAFREAYRRRRCLVPADGFYEWRKTGSGKQPYRVSRAGGLPFAFAGLWECWGAYRGQTVRTFTVLTTEADRRIAHIHHRMPVMLATEGEFAVWLEGTEAEWPDVLKPYGAADLVVTPVSGRVGNVRNDDPGLLVPVPEVPQQGSLF